MGLALAFVPGGFEVDLGSAELVLFSCLLASFSHALLGTGACLAPRALWGDSPERLACSGWRGCVAPG